MNSSRAWGSRGGTRFPQIGVILCRVGLHDWSDNKGGIKVCERSDCRAAKTYGLTGAMRQTEWEEQLYEQYQQYIENDDD
jgi:hypothetical protein